MEHVSKLVREMVELASKVRDLAPRWVRLQQLDFQVNEWRSISDRTAIDPNILLDIESCPLILRASDMPNKAVADPARCFDYLIERT